MLRTQIELRRAVQQADMLEAENRLLRAEGRPELIAQAASMQPVLELLARIGPSDANVLITGEHGTGKEVVAQTLHALSSRASRTAASARLSPCNTISAPHAAVRVTLVAGVNFGMTIVAGIPSSFACRATAWA